MSDNELAALVAPLIEPLPPFFQFFAGWAVLILVPLALFFALLIVGTMPVVGLVWLLTEGLPWLWRRLTSR